MKKVSVIVPVYNVEKYLDKCLDSLVNQTLKDIEIIVVNDGTKDNSQKIINEYVKKYPKLIKPFIKENGGLSSARNYGLKYATGKYIGFVDSDDYVEYDMFEQLYNKAESTSSDIVCSQIAYRYATKVEKRYFSDESIFGKSVSESPRILIAGKSFAWNKIYKRSLWNNFEFPDQHFEDSAVIYNVMYTAKKIECVNMPLYNYIKEREGAITTNVTPKIYDIFKSCDSILDFYKKQNDYENIKDVIEELCIRHLIIRLLYIYNSKNRKLTWKYYNDTKKYLKDKIPNYKKNNYLKNNKDKNHNKKIALLKYPCLFKILSISHKFIFKISELFKLPFVLLKKYKNNRSKKSLQKRYDNISQNGIPILEETLNILNNIPDVKAFADFGTLLGLIREKALLKHDLDIDTAVLGKPNLYKYVTMIMQNHGYRLYREYRIDDKVVEQSYFYKEARVDINYYEYRGKGINTWLFYRDPKKKYKNNTRNIVRMDYSMVNEIKKIKIQGRDLYIPDNYEKLLEEKYGENWRVPDKGWVYWQNPSATKIKDIGMFIEYIHVEEEA